MGGYEAEHGMEQEPEFDPVEGPALGKKALPELEPDRGLQPALGCVDANPAEVELGHQFEPEAEPEAGPEVASSQDHGSVKGPVSVTDLGSLWSSLWTRSPSVLGPLCVVQTELMLSP